MVHPSDSRISPRSVALDCAASPETAEALAAVADLLTLVYRSRMLHQSGAPSAALIVHLARCGPMRATELSRSMMLNQSTVSRQLTSLADAGLVERRSDPDDGRAQVMSVTAAGWDAAYRSLADWVRDFEQVIDTWPTSDRVEFARLLNRFSTDFEGRHRRSAHLNRVDSDPGKNL